MSTEIVKHTASLTEKIAYSDNLACSDILPKQFQKKPANVLWAIEYGETLGITTMAALTGIHVIEGKPGASAALIGGLVRRAGHKLRVTGNNHYATAQIVRSDDPDYTFEVTWELHRNERGNPNAEDAGVLGKQVWKNYPAAMLKARAITQVARDACEEILFGLHYTPEELGAEVDAEGEPIEQRARRQYGQSADDPWQTPVQDGPVAVEPEPAPVQEAEYAEVVEDRPPAATQDQVNQILATLKAHRVKNIDAARAIISKHAGREIGGPADLTAAEADQVLEKLTATLPEPEQQPETAPAGPAPVGTPDNPLHTPSQMKMIQATLAEKGITDPQAKRDLIGRILGVRIERVRDLSKEQASRVVEAFRTGEIPPAPEPLVDRLAAQMRAAQSSEELADHAEWMWKAHEAGELSRDEVSKLQDVSLAREAELAQTARAAA